MRIRNRKVPFPLSSLSPVPLSDPPFSDLFPLQSNQLNDNPSNQPNNLIGDGTSCRNSSEYTSNQPQYKFLLKEGRDQDGDPNGGEEEGEKICNLNRKQTVWGAKTLISSLHQGDNVSPLKNRRKSNVETEIKDKKLKCDASKNGAKKRVRGSAVMEGSRCSRVNGRGWRCCQPTLVGYSLCEHHLGKGRLRSMASVRSQTATPSKVEARSLSIEGREMKPAVDEDEMQKLVLMSKRKHKVGMVKARSMSSLLGQENNATMSIAENGMKNIDTGN